MKGLQAGKEGKDGGMRGRPQGRELMWRRAEAMVGENVCVCMCLLLGETCSKSIHALLNGILSPSLFFAFFKYSHSLSGQVSSSTSYTLFFFFLQSLMICIPLLRHIPPVRPVMASRLWCHSEQYNQACLECSFGLKGLTLRENGWERIKCMGKLSGKMLKAMEIAHWMEPKETKD